MMMVVMEFICEQIFHSLTSLFSCGRVSLSSYPLTFYVFGRHLYTQFIRAINALSALCCITQLKLKSDLMLSFALTTEISVGWFELLALYHPWGFDHVVMVDCLFKWITHSEF